MTNFDDKLSFLLDEYTDKSAADSVDAVIGDVNLQYRMRRFQMIGEAMRHELPPAIDTGFHSAVMARVREETAVQPQHEVRNSPAESVSMFASLVNWASLRPVAGLAVAASVALVTVALWQPLQQESSGQQDTVVSADQQKIQQLAKQQGQSVAVPASSNDVGMRWKVDREAPGLQQKLNAYLVNHTEYSNSVQGLIPQARVAGFDAQQ